MPTLSNHRWELFAQALAKGNTATEAYRNAGYKDNRQAASRLFTNVDVMNRVAELQQRGAIRAEVTIESICRELDGVCDDAKVDKQHSARVASIMGKAKVCGLLKDKIEATGKDGGPIQTDTVLNINFVHPRQEDDA